MHAPSPVCDRSAGWQTRSFEIHLSSDVSFGLLMLMKTDGQYVQQYGDERIVYVPAGQFRCDSPEFIECKDCFGIPFGWSKKLVAEVVSQDGSVLWFK